MLDSETMLLVENENSRVLILYILVEKPVRSDDNINMDVPAYADAAGKLHVVLPIGSIAGAEAYTHLLTLDTINE